MKYDVAKKILAFCSAGHYLFAMCSGAETFDIALAAQGQDIESELGEDLGIALDYSKSLVFENFELQDGRIFSDINMLETNLQNKKRAVPYYFNTQKSSYASSQDHGLYHRLHLHVSAAAGTAVNEV